MHKKIQLFSFPILFFAFLISCGEPESENRKIEESIKEEQSGKQDQHDDSTGILQMSQTIMEILEEKNYKRLQQQDRSGDAIVTKVWETVEANKNPPINKNDYLGIYKDPWFGKMEVFLKKGQLWIKSYRSPKLNGPMRFYKANTFAIKWEYQDMNADAFATFNLDENGIPQELRLKGISPNIDFSFDFQDLHLIRIKTE